ncbi:Arsenate reductase [Mycobacterium senriense]|uniref:Arsenate reductase ArsC n=1 Tax=Mycobacterium senriense TaxID=2775496 RepID=A0ABN6ID11_9MYCO|nr:putative arsenate reductase ArsC [Mycobacterium senriense]
MQSDKAAREPPRRIEPFIDQRHALESAAARLYSEFADTLNPETIDWFLYSSYDRLAATATVHDFLALLAERFARQRLRAVAKVEGKITEGKPVVLFLCNHNAGRSQMAMGFFTSLAGDAAVAWSGGSKPKGEINPAVIAVMAERGIDLANEYPKPWSLEILQAADVVITMGCGDAAPILPGRRYEDWVLDDPDGKDVAAVRSIRDEIEGRVRRLVDELLVADFVTLAEAAEHLDMREATIRRLIADGMLTGWVDWGEVEAKLLPLRRPRHHERFLR